MKKKTTEQFISDAKEIHGDRYNYDKVVYIKAKSKVIITCSIHGDYTQAPYHHKSGQGCPDCGKISSIKNQTYTISDFISKAIETHGDKYDYGKVIYGNSRTKVIITCSYHGEFEQLPVMHLMGQGCPDCDKSRTYTNQELINSLTIEEEPMEVDGVIQCRCSHCKEYFIPTRVEIRSRMKRLSGRGRGESRLYCSDQCKNDCSIYYQSSYQKGVKPYTNTSRPDQGPLRDIVLERDNHTCQICGSTDDLICHHLTGVETNPIESADVDNCTTLCYTCHQRSHSICGSGDFRRQKCVSIQ